MSSCLSNVGEESAKHVCHADTLERVAVHASAPCIDFNDAAGVDLLGKRCGGRVDETNTKLHQTIRLFDHFSYPGRRHRPSVDTDIRGIRFVDSALCSPHHGNWAFKLCCKLSDRLILAKAGYICIHQDCDCSRSGDSHGRGSREILEHLRIALICNRDWRCRGHDSDVREVGWKLQIHWLFLQNASTNTTINVRNCCLGCDAGLRRRELAGADHHVIEVSVASRMMHEAVSFYIGQP